MKILVTGGTGFVGSALCKVLYSHGYKLHVALRHAEDIALLPKSAVPFVVGDIDGQTDWTQALAGCEVVMHLAARVHIMQDAAKDPLTEYRKTNTEATLHLAEEAVKAGIKRFIFASSIKVNGEETSPGQPFTANDLPAPQDPYGISKYEAETGLMKLALQTRMDVVIVRPPLVYGPGVKANFETMLRWLARGIPLPLGMVTNNRRSFVALDNLVDLLIICIEHPIAANQVFLASDGEDLSTAVLMEKMSKALGKHPILLPVPPAILKAGAKMLGCMDAAQRLLGSLQVDISKTQALLGWSPPLSADEGFRQTAEAFLRKR